MSHILQLSPCDDLMELIGKSVVKRRKVLKQIAREQRATLTYWTFRSSEKWVSEYLKTQRCDLSPFQIERGHTKLSFYEGKGMWEVCRLKKYGINFGIKKYGIKKYGK
jgi:hypothetical protein